MLLPIVGAICEQGPGLGVWAGKHSPGDSDGQACFQQQPHEGACPSCLLLRPQHRVTSSISLKKHPLWLCRLPQSCSCPGLVGGGGAGSEAPRPGVRSPSCAQCPSVPRMLISCSGWGAGGANPQETRGVGSGPWLAARNISWNCSLAHSGVFGAGAGCRHLARCREGEYVRDTFVLRDRAGVGVDAR